MQKHRLSSVRKEPQGTKNVFSGKHKPAVARLRHLAKLACEHLPAERLNLASFHLAAYLDAEFGRICDLTGQMSTELETERATMGNRMRPEMSTADRQLLRECGIKV